MKRRFRTPETQCPACGYALNRCSNFDGWSPSPGCLTVCIQCAEVMEFDQTLTPQKLEPLKLMQILLQQPDLISELRIAQEAVRRVQAEKETGNDPTL